MYFIRPFHQSSKRIHGTIHFAVIQSADVKIKVFEGFKAGVCQLRHGVVRIAKHDPFCFIDAIVESRAGKPVVHVQLVGWNIRKFCCIATCTNGDVGLHAFHLLQTAFVHKCDLLFTAGEQKFACHCTVTDVHVRQTALCINLLDQLTHQIFAAVPFIIYEYFIAGLHTAGIIDQ